MLQYYIGKQSTPAGPPPDAPSGLASSTITKSTIGITWTDNADDESGYYVYVKLSAAGSYSSYEADLGANSESYTITGLDSDTLYDIKVVAYNVDGESDADEITSIQTLSAPVVIFCRSNGGNMIWMNGNLN